MEKLGSIQELLVRSRRLPVVIIGLALAVLAITIFLARQQLRQSIRTQIAGRDGEVLYAVAMMHVAGLKEEFEDPVDAELFGSIEDPANQLLVVLKTAQLKSVMAARLYDPSGQCTYTFPENVRPGSLSPQELTRLRQFQPVSRFRPQVAWTNLFDTLGEEAGWTNATTPILEVSIPLHEGDPPHLVGIAQFVIEGESLAREFARLDTHLTLQALAAFGVSGGVLVGLLGWAFRRLRHSYRLLQERTQNLIRANQELALAARTSALGAVTAHLIHGLKSPLSGLQNFVAGQHNDIPNGGTDLEAAVASARRMQAMVNQVVNVLREEEGLATYELTLEELADVLRSRLKPLAQEHAVRLEVQAQVQTVRTPPLSNRTANLITLILNNLVQNAIEASPRDGVVEVQCTTDESAITFRVRDQGPGLPETVRNDPFVPRRSTKQGGSGIGLAICKQLANHLRAELRVERTGPDGTVFVLRLPLTDPDAPSAEA